MHSLTLKTSLFHVCPGSSRGDQCTAPQEHAPRTKVSKSQDLCQGGVRPDGRRLRPPSTPLSVVRVVRPPAGHIRSVPSGGAGNNGPVSTAVASSFLNGPGALRSGRPLARPERVTGVAGPLADLAALVSPSLPGIPGPLQVRDWGSGQPPPGAEGPELQVRPGQPPAAMRSRIAATRGRPVTSAHSG